MCSRASAFGSLSLVVPVLLASACMEPVDVDESNIETWVPTISASLSWEGTTDAPDLGPPGYDAALDLPKKRCLRIANSPGSKPFDVGAVQGQARLTYIDSKETLANELGLNVGLRAKAVAAPISGNAKFGIVKKYNQDSNDIFFLLKTSRTYTVQSEMDLEFTEEARAILDGTSEWRGRETGPLPSEDDEAAREAAIKFIGECGTDYVKGMRYEAAAYALVRIHTASETDSTRYDLSGAVEGTIEGIAEVKSDFGVTNANSSGENDLSIEVTIEASGFSFDGALSSTAQLNKPSEILAHMQRIETQMVTSITRDQCRDRYLGPKCGSDTAPGYLGNDRDAEVSEVYLGNYFKNESFPAVTPIIHQLRDDAADVMSTCLQAYEEMVDKFRAGVSMMADSGIHYNFHHLDTSSTRYNYNLSELRAEATRQKNAFDPDTLGSHTKAIQGYMKTCYDNAGSGDYHYCAEVAEMIQPGNTSPESVEYQRHVQAIDSNKPLVPLLYDVIDDIQTFNGARDQCDFDGQFPHYTAYPNLVSPYYGYGYYGGFYERSRRAWRLPTQAEADRLSVVFLEHGDVPNAWDERDESWPADWSGEKLIWTEDEAACPHSQFHAQGAGVARIESDGTVTHGCLEYQEWSNFIIFKQNNLDNGAKASTLCVPDLGPYPQEYLQNLL